MSLPDTVSEKDFVRLVEHIARILFKKFGSIHGTNDDFAQQVAVWALEALPKYDPGRSLDAFLYAHARNRALNWSRDHYHRSDPPCQACHSGSPCGSNGSCCRKYARWRKRNQTKANLARPIGLENIAEKAGPSTVEDAAVERELAQRIDEQLPIDLRSFYLRMLAGDPVDTGHRQKVQRAVAEILGLELSGH